VSTAEVLAAWESESSLIDSALKHVRHVAHLDDDPILPKLAPPSRSGIAAIPSPAIFYVPVPEVAAASAAPVARPEPKATRRTIRWPVRFCGLIAIGYAVAAFLASPMGHRPEVVRVTSKVQVGAQSGWHAASAFVHAHVNAR